MCSSDLTLVFIRNSAQPTGQSSPEHLRSLNSHNFDIEANIRDGDSRAGLDERGTQEVLEIMRREGVK